MLGAIKGVGEVTGEQLTGQLILQVRVDPQAIARYGVPTRNVMNVVEAVGTKKVGEVREGQRRFPLVVRLPDRQRTDPDALANTLIQTATGSVLPLNQVAQVVETEGPATINREWGRRRITVQCNVRGRDVGSFVAEAQKKIADQVKLPEGYSIEWGGQFENMERANARAALRGADGARADIRPALLQPEIAARHIHRGHGHSAGCGGRRAGVVAARDALHRQRGGRIHRPERRGDPQRPGPRDVHQTEARCGRTAASRPCGRDVWCACARC